MKKISSILDYSYPYLDPAIWNEELKLHVYQKDFILRLIDKMYENYQLKQPEVWVTDICIIGSLTTSKWLFTSDIDVHLHVDLTKFIETNMPGADRKVAFDYLDNTRKEFDRAKILAPMTQHPIEYYFEVPEFVASNTSLVGVYSVIQDKWLKKPVMFDADLDFEESKKDVMAQAEALAEEFEGSFGKIDRQINRIDELEKMINAWGPDKQQLFYKKIEDKLKVIEDEITKDIEIRQQLVDERHEAQDPMADIEIKFKWLARFGFFGILQNLKTLMTQTEGKVTPKELPLIKKIVTEAAKQLVKNPGLWEGKKFWSGMADTRDGQILEVHTYETAEANSFHHSFYVSPELVEAMRYGEAIFFWIEDDGSIETAWGDNVENSLEGNDTGLKQKIRSQISINKQNSLKEAFLTTLSNMESEQTIFVDFDDTIAKENSDHSIGELLPGAKETIEKLREKGFKVIIDSHRANDKNGRKEIEEFLKTNDIEVDGFYEGDKPLAFRYIDDRAIRFDNWDNVLKQVEKSEKKASLTITAIDAYYHGGSGDSIRQIAKDGYVMAPLETGRANQSPLAGRAYLTKDLGYALIYALGANMVGSSDVSHVSGGPEGGVVLVAPNEDALIPDEDWLGEQLTSGFGGESNFAYDTLKSQQALAPVFNNMKKQRQGRLWDATYQSMIGKMAIRILQNYNPAYLKQLAKESPNMSHEGNMKVLQAWVFDKARDNPNLKPDGSNFFNVAQEIPVTKTASLKIARLNQKYWIDPSGKEIPIDARLGHYGWIYENVFKKPYDGHSVVPQEAMGQVEDKAQEMISQGWTRITTESDYDFAMEVADINNLPGYLDNFVASHYTGGGVEIDDLNGDYQDLSDPFPSLAKQINKAVRLRRQPVAKLFSKRDIVAQTKKVKQGDYSCVMALVPHDLAQEIVEWGVRNVPDDKIYLSDGGKLGRELESHVTIKYGLLTNNAKDVRRSFNEDKPYKAKLGKVRHFQPPELPFDVLTVEIVSEDLDKVNKRITKSFECATDLPSDEYKPHVTIAYMKRDTAKDYIGADVFEGKEIELDTIIFSPHKGNRTYFSISHDKESIFIIETMNKTASGDNFLPSLFNAPNNEWQFQHGGDDQEIGVDPDAVSDETTWYAPCTEGKPRTKEVWRAFISMFKNPFSKKEEMTIQSSAEELINIGTFNAGKHGKFPIEVPADLLEKYFNSVTQFNRDLNLEKDVSKLDKERLKIHNQLMEFAFNRIAPNKNFKDFPMVAGDIRHQISQFIDDMVPREDLLKDSAYDPELAKKEKDSLGEDQTLLEYMKDFPDQAKKDFPHNTTWDPIYQDGEPSKPGMPVTYSPQISNDDNLDQNSPGGFPRRFMGKPKGEWTSNQGEADKVLIDMLRRRNAALDIITKDITADYNHAYWIDPNGKIYEVRGKSGHENSPKNTHDGWIQDNLSILKQEYGFVPVENQWGSHLGSGDLIDAGWIRIGDAFESAWGITVKDIHNIPTTVDGLLSQFAYDGAKITIENNSYSDVASFKWPVRSVQQAVNRALRQPVAASKKQASIEEVNGTNVLVNPTYQEMNGLASKLKQHVFRGLIDPNTGDLFVWDAFFSEHTAMISALGLNMKYDMDSPYVLYFHQPDISQILEKQQQIKQQLKNPKRQHQMTAELKKQAGEQSASVPDYLMDEWKTDQINNDTDEEPYVNHQERDYPYGMQDAPQNTGYAFPWAKDISPYVVRLDILENPVYRLDPFGVGEYNVTWYESLPASDGIEATNP